jgi:asparagine synthetase B (glutamine-hydrolysing)
MEDGNSVALGKIFNTNTWSQPLAEFPDGSYALFRNSQEYFEIVSDAAASRTIWYYQTNSLFVASTSQRAIVMFIGKFEFDERVIPWVLSTGSLGPSFSWDKRINRLGVDSSVILNKGDWTVSIKSNPVKFKPQKKSRAEHENLLEESLTATFKSLDLDFSHWVLPLSGGYDSRGILCVLSETTNVENLRTITWGLQASENVKGNDASVAKELADALHVQHKYYNTDLSNEPVGNVIDRFVRSGEGCIDHLSGYMDGFKIWKTLYGDGIEGIIRGDEGFGWEQVSDDISVRSSVGCNLCADYSNLKDYKKYGFPSQEMPQHLNRSGGETLATWRDRLYHQYRIPTILAALSDLKLSYVEQITPLLSRAILHQVRQLPDNLRTGKVLFKKIVKSKSPEVGFAVRSAVASLAEIVRRKEIADFLKNELSSGETRKLFPADFMKFVLEGVRSESEEKKREGHSAAIRSGVKRHLPYFLKVALRKFTSKKLDHNILAFRVFVITSMNRILSESSIKR